MLELKRVGLICRDERAEALIENLRQILARASIELGELGDERVEPPPDLVIALGGDGTVLRALALYPHTPTLPINFGHVGFLTAGGEEEAEKLIFRLLANDYLIEERVLLISEFQGRRREVVNEVVVKGTTKMVSVELHVDGELIHTIRGDGAIVGTPTGSTSYLLSTRGPIVAPRVQCIVVNGINEHRFASRSLVLPDTSRIRLRIEESSRDTEMFLSHDGRDKIPIRNGDQVDIRRAAEPARLIFFDSHAFFRNLKSRLDW
jgi:NAD+ kinase